MSSTSPTTARRRPTAPIDSSPAAGARSRYAPRRGYRRTTARRLVRRAVRQVHVYVGLVLSLLFFLFAVTGAALVYKEAYWRLVYPELRAPSSQLSAADHAAAIAAAQREFGDELRSIKLPEPGVTAYHLYLDDGEAFLSAVDYSVIDRWRPSERVMSLLFDLRPRPGRALA